MMKRGAMGVAVALAMTVGGCETGKSPFDPDKPLDKMSKEEWCSYYAFYLTNPAISNESRLSATRQMRARGCPGYG